jgi:NTP pyrophosphatase (non-canonical NTP hydrolase)
MVEIEKEVLDWHRSTFPNATNTAVLEKLKEETLELLAELVKPSTRENTEKEIADVAIVSISLLNRWGTSLSDQIKLKLEINKLRSWGDEDKNGDRPRIK